MRARDHPSIDRRAARRDGSCEADDRGGLGRVQRLRLRLLRGRFRRVAAWPRPGGGHRCPTGPTGCLRVHLSGRWRPGGDRDRRDRPCGRPGREDQCRLRQQRHLRDDRRATRSDLAHRSAHDVHADRTRPGTGRLSDPHHRDAGAAAGGGLCGSRIHLRSGHGRQDEGDAAPRLPGPARWRGPVHRGSPVHLPGRLGHDSGRGDGARPDRGPDDLPDRGHRGPEERPRRIGRERPRDGHRRLRRPGAAVRRQGPRPGGHDRGKDGLVDAVLRAGDAWWHGVVHGDRVGPRHRLTHRRHRRQRDRPRTRRRWPSSSRCSRPAGCW